MQSYNEKLWFREDKVAYYNSICGNMYDFNNDGKSDVASYYLSYKDDFETIRAELSIHGVEYPAMKLMDMCMWQVAFEASIEE